jgi:hypothetical protein
MVLQTDLLDPVNRVFADIDEERGVIRIHDIGRRENLYT